MGEWLTTGEIIDYLINNPERKAENDKGTVIQYAYGDMRLMDLTDKYQTVEAHRLFLISKWRILPNYVSFEEAMVALKNGKTVAFYYDGIYKVVIQKHKNDLSELYHKGVMIHELTEGKWTIED